jgi:hypothetical protein
VIFAMLNDVSSWEVAMRKLGLGVAVAALPLVLMMSPAQAVPIAAGSELSTNGSDTFTATSISFLNPGNIGGTSGSFQTVFGTVPPQITGVVTFSNFTNVSSNFQLYTATVGTNVTTLVAASIDSFIFTPGTPLESLDVKGTGTLTLTGFDATPGNWELTTQGPGGTATVTFSQTSVAAAPEPATLGILGTALLAMGWAAKRRRDFRG